MRNINKLNQIKCYITCTNKNTHKIIKNNLHESPLYNGKIIGKGPRYCLSIEDKVTQFSNRDKHNVFLEPESLTSDIIYPNGISTSLPFKIQRRFVNSIKGMENAKIITPGYAVEYLFFNPKYLYPTLESKIINNLFFAGQINGTTGYEEAAAQGIVAGINAALKFSQYGNNYFIPNRLNSYIGVLIDDLCTKGVDEPYRMFTSRSENRLFLREDNADYRLTPIGYKLGLINKKKWVFYKKKIKHIYKIYKYIKNKKINTKYLPNNIFKKYFSNYVNTKLSLKFLILNFSIKLKNIIHLFKKCKEIMYLKEIEILIKYEGYLKRQKSEINKFYKYKNTIIPDTIDYSSINGLSKEVICNLSKYKPSSLKEAYNIPGVTPSSIIMILIYLKKNKFH